MARNFNVTDSLSPSVIASQNDVSFLWILCFTLSKMYSNTWGGILSILQNSSWSHCIWHIGTASNRCHPHNHTNQCTIDIHYTCIYSMTFTSLFFFHMYKYFRYIDIYFHYFSYMKLFFWPMSDVGYISTDPCEHRSFIRFIIDYLMQLIIFFKIYMSVVYLPARLFL